MKHYNEADLLETYYTQPGQSMPVMMHLADCRDKLREAAVCNTEKPATFWTRQRLQIMRRVDAQNAQANTAARTWRVAAAAVLAFFLGGAVVYETVKPAQHQPAPVVAVTPSTTVAPAPAANDIHDAWQSDELKDFHNVVEWEAWVPDEKTSTNRGNSL